MYKSIIIKAGIITFSIVLIGLLMGLMSPFNLKNSITPDQLKFMLNETNSTTQFIDVSTSNIYMENRITGFSNIAFSSFEKDYTKLDHLNKELPVIIISNNESISREAVVKFRHAGFENVRFVIGTSASYIKTHG